MSEMETIHKSVSVVCSDKFKKSTAGNCSGKLVKPTKQQRNPNRIGAIVAKAERIGWLAYGNT